MTSAAPCRLFVYPAREAPLAVVLRRGPSDWARLSIWRTDSDAFEHGQWIKGRVYERRSDLSADGSLFAAFVRQSGGRVTGPGRDTWLALSRPPFFTALALWFVGGTYFTGGFFPERDSLWTGFMSQAPDRGELPAWLRMVEPRGIAYIDGTNNWTDRTVHFNRLLRDGWSRIEDGGEGALRSRWQRAEPGGGRLLLMRQGFEGFGRYGGPYAVDFALRQADGAEIDLGRASWGDWDQRGRLVLARDGRLERWTGDGFELIADFNEQRPDPQPAPAWATAWPPAPRPLWS